MHELLNVLPVTALGLFLCSIPAHFLINAYLDRALQPRRQYLLIPVWATGMGALWLFLSEGFGILIPTIAARLIAAGCVAAYLWGLTKLERNSKTQRNK